MLVGTQMVAKGHDFPDVVLSVVLDADATLRFPDFRAEERTFALVARSSGNRRVESASMTTPSTTWGSGPLATIQVDEDDQDSAAWKRSRVRSAPWRAVLSASRRKTGSGAAGARSRSRSAHCGAGRGQGGYEPQSGHSRGSRRA